jgi:hypothetical protein
VSRAEFLTLPGVSDHRLYGARSSARCVKTGRIPTPSRGRAMASATRSRLAVGRIGHFLAGRSVSLWMMTFRQQENDFQLDFIHLKTFQQTLNKKLPVKNQFKFIG